MHGELVWTNRRPTCVFLRPNALYVSCSTLNCVYFTIICFGSESSLLVGCSTISNALLRVSQARTHGVPEILLHQHADFALLRRDRWWRNLLRWTSVEVWEIWGPTRARNVACSVYARIHNSCSDSLLRVWACKSYTPEFLWDYLWLYVFSSYMEHDISYRCRLHVSASSFCMATRCVRPGMNGLNTNPIRIVDSPSMHSCICRSFGA